MRLITKESLIATAAHRWRDAHQRRGQWLPAADNPDSQEIYQRLLALPDNAGEEQITVLVGDNRCTQNICHECGEDADITLAVGAEPHHATDSSVVCLPCLKQALALATSAA
jgi:hypothetical protein